VKQIETMRAEMLADYADILTQTYPAFSDEEMHSREARLLDIADARGLDAVLVVEAARAGSATGWITGWPVTAEAVTVLGRTLPRTMYVQHYNHLPLARRIAWRTAVEWGRKSGVAEAADLMRRGGARKVGLVGRLPMGQFEALAATFDLTDLNADYTRLRLVKSAEEIRWMELAAALTDLGIAALAEGARPGMDERELGALVESGFLRHGATSFLHYFLATPMHAPDGGVPRQYGSTRPLAEGDTLSTEISADFWGYTGQVLRTFFVGTEPTAAWRDMHEVAEAALDAILAKVRPGTTAGELVDASAVIEDAGYTIIDDLVHGYGGGYLPPVLGTASRPSAVPRPDLTLAENMCLVVQPNVTTTDGMAGVQTGHLIQVTADGYRDLQRFPRGYQIIG
jgi:Xaa-Pro aminopeptidase